MSPPESDHLPVSVKLGYGAASGAMGMVFTLVSVYFLIFLTDVVGLDPAAAGFVIMLGMICDACVNPAVGVGSDRLKSRWGRRRPFLLAAALPYAVVSWLLFSDPALGDAGVEVYFSVMIILYFAVNALVEVPYISLAAEMTQDYDERTSLIGFRMAWSQVGSIVGAALPPLAVAYFAGLLGDERTGWSTMAGLFGVASVPAILITWRATRGHEVFTAPTDGNTMSALRDALRNRPFRYAVGLWCFGGVAIGVSGNLIMYFMTYVLQFNEERASLALLILFACGALWIPIINMTSARLGKRPAFTIYIGAWAVLQGGAALLLTPDTAWLFFPGLFLASPGVASFFIIGYAMIADVVEVDEFKSGHRREGVYFGSAFFVQKVAAAFMIWGVGLGLSHVGYVPDVPQTDTALAGIRGLYGVGSAAAFFASLVFCFFMPMTRKNHAALRECLRRKNAGEIYDTKAIEELIR